MRASTSAAARLELSCSICAGLTTECAALCSRTGCRTEHNQKQSDFFTVDFPGPVTDEFTSEGRR